MTQRTEKYEFLAMSFLDAAVAPLPDEELRKRLNNLVAQFFYLGAVDFLRQVESLDHEEFQSLVAKTFDRYGVKLHTSVEDYLRTVAAQIHDVPSLEQAMREGAEAIRAFWGSSDTTAPLRLGAMLKSIDGLDEEYERAFRSQS